MGICQFCGVAKGEEDQGRRQAACFCCFLCFVCVCVCLCLMHVFSCVFCFFGISMLLYVEVKRRIWSQLVSIGQAFICAHEEEEQQQCRIEVRVLCSLAARMVGERKLSGKRQRQQQLADGRMEKTDVWKKGGN